MKKLLCLVLPLFALCTGFKVPSSNQQLDNELKRNWCGGYLTIDNSDLLNYPKVTLVMVSDDLSPRLYNVPAGSSTYDVPETFHTGEYYGLTFYVNSGTSFPGFPADGEWTLEIKRPDGTVARKVLFETDGTGLESVVINSFTPECLSYEVSIRRRSLLD